MKTKCVLSNSDYARKKLAKERCCGRNMRIDGFYSQGIETTTAFCRKCGCYVSVETGQLDPEELDEKNGKVVE